MSRLSFADWAIVQAAMEGDGSLARFNALYHVVITMENLPPDELARWRVMFDHYVFEASGDLVEHLPQQARGILGRRTPELIARVKKLLIEALSR